VPEHVKCDVLVVSGHFNGHDFFSDQLDAREYLPVAEMERVSCSNACPASSRSSRKSISSAARA
jgi:hypothetical protein